jgi:hypothetical protein
MALIFVDCEGHGRAPGLNNEKLFEFGAVCEGSRESFHGVGGSLETFLKFRDWIGKVSPTRPVFVSDNPAYDWQFINYYFHKHLGENPFGHSARRISDFYAGLTGDWSNTQAWKRLRTTDHDHNPVNDAMGNLEAFSRIMKGER